MSPKESFWIGAKGGLLDEKHRRKMRESVWLFLYLLRNQTDLNDAGEGVVNYGHPLTLKQIAFDTHGWKARTMSRWIDKLRREGYIRTAPHSHYGVTFWIAKGKSKTKVPRIVQTKVTTKFVQSSTPVMAGKSHTSTPDVAANILHSMPDNVSKFPVNDAQPNGNNGYAPFSETPTPKGLTSESPSYYNKDAAAKNAAVVSSFLREVGAKKTPPRRMSQAELEERQRLLYRQGQELAAKYAATH